MKKCYSLLMASAVCIAGVASSASATTIPAKNLTNRNSPVKTHNSIRLADVIKDAGSEAKQRQSPSFTPPAGEWTLLGNATWTEDILTIFEEFDPGLSWEVPIYQSNTNPGYYRIAPYVDGSPVAEVMEMPDPNAIFYINATNPNKVYVDGDVTLYNSFLISQLTPENEWSEYEVYGTFSDGEFEFPAESFAVAVQGQFHLSTLNGGFKISLPGAVAKDYSVSIFAPFCAENNSLTAELTKGADASTVKYMILPGFFQSSTENNAFIAEKGETLAEGASTIQLTGDKPGMYTLMVTSLSGTVAKKGAARTFFILDDDADNWETLDGKAHYTDGYFTGIFEDFESETLDVTVQEHKTMKGYYRLEEPYTTHTSMDVLTHESHKHYLYINATNPERVFIEPSPLGVDDPQVGEIFGWSYAHLYVINDAEDDAVNSGLFGKKTGNVITMPEKSLLISMNKYQDGALFYTGNGFKVVIPDESAVNEIESDCNSDVEYFNLQGIRVSEPSNGLYIRKSAGKSEKVML